MELMTKPHKPRSDSSVKAPKTLQPKSPFQRNREAPHKPEKPAAREPGRGVRPAGKAAGSNKARPANPAKTPGALINRRAADRLRAGYLWVYASDIESIEAPETGSGGP